MTYGNIMISKLRIQNNKSLQRAVHHLVQDLAANERVMTLNVNIHRRS